MEFKCDNMPQQTQRVSSDPRNMKLHPILKTWRHLAELLHTSYLDHHSIRDDPQKIRESSQNVSTLSPTAFQSVAALPSRNSFSKQAFERHCFQALNPWAWSISMCHPLCRSLLANSCDRRFFKWRALPNNLMNSSGWPASPKSYNLYSHCSGKHIFPHIYTLTAVGSTFAQPNEVKRLTSST